MDSTQDKIIKKRIPHIEKDIVTIKRKKEEVNENKEVIKKEVIKKEVTKEIFLKNKINSKINDTYGATREPRRCYFDDYKKVDKIVKNKFPDENINLETLKYIDVMNEINKLTNNLTNAYNCPICSAIETLFYKKWFQLCNAH